MPAYPKKSIIPPGGYHYKESHAGVTVELRGESVEHLAEVLLRFRINNGIPAGNPLQDITDYICTSWPHFCAESEPAFIPPKNPHARRHLSNRISEWVGQLFRIGAKGGVNQSVASGRASICAACPQNVDYRPGGCGSCIDSMERLAFIWLRQRSTPSDAALGGCRLLGQHNRCAAHAAVLPPVSPELNAELPAKCWRKTP